MLLLGVWLVGWAPEQFCGTQVCFSTVKSSRPDNPCASALAPSLGTATMRAMRTPSGRPQNVRRELPGNRNCDGARTLRGVLDPPTTPGGGNSYMFLHGHISCGARGSNPPIWPVTAGLTTPGPILIVQVAVNV